MRRRRPARPRAPARLSPCAGRRAVRQPTLPPVWHCRWGPGGELTVRRWRQGGEALTWTLNPQHNRLGRWAAFTSPINSPPRSCSCVAAGAAAASQPRRSRRRLQTYRPARRRRIAHHPPPRRRRHGGGPDVATSTVPVMAVAADMPLFPSLTAATATAAVAADRARPGRVGPGPGRIGFLLLMPGP